MGHALTLVDTLKRLLKQRGLTYAALAARIDMSEANVKRMFSQKSFTLQRLDQVLAAANISFAELTEAQEGPALITHLTLAQERELIASAPLLVVAVAAMNGYGFEAIVEEYALEPAQVTGLLLRLDAMGLLELLPNNRVKLLLSRNFSWLPDGPIQQWFRAEAAADYLGSDFHGAHESLQMTSLMLTAPSIGLLRERLKQLAADFAELHQHEARMPMASKRAVTLLLAARPWVPQAFQALRRRMI
jgi:transcriptional regulator with XRE-family HTH domain